MVWRIKKTVLQVGMENGQTDLSWFEGFGNANNHSSTTMVERQTLRWIRRSFLSARNRSLRPQWSQTQQNSTKQFKFVRKKVLNLRKAGSEFGITKAGVGGVMVRGMSAWHSFGTLTPTDHRLKDSLFENWYLYACPRFSRLLMA